MILIFSEEVASLEDVDDEDKESPEGLQRTDIPSVICASHRRWNPVSKMLKCCTKAGYDDSRLLPW